MATRSGQPPDGEILVGHTPLIKSEAAKGRIGGSILVRQISTIPSMAAVAVEKWSSEEHMRDRALRGLQVAVVSGFVKDCRAAQESCLGLCNACREGVPVERMLVREWVPQILLAMVLPNAAKARQEGGIPPTRVLHPRRVLRLEWTFRSHAWWAESTGQVSKPSAGTPSVGDVDFSEVQWPEGTREISLILFDKAVEGMAWPV
ncbi:unnamed protein product, partial [Ectocarpus sp. 12 AP-2014]